VTIHTTARALAALLSLATLSSCGIFGSDSPRLASVDDLVVRIERVHVESELSKDSTRVAIQALQSFLQHDYGAGGDAVAAYQSFVQTIDECESQTEQLRLSVDSMKYSAGPVFEQWNADLSSYSSDGMRRRSEARLSDTRGRYDAILAAVDPTLAACDSFNAGLRDHALFLGHDFNAEAISVLGGEMETLRKQYEGLAVRVERLGDAAREYMRTSAPLTTITATPQSAARR
jgi:hypothetical protein